MRIGIPSNMFHGHPTLSEKNVSMSSIQQTISRHIDGTFRLTLLQFVAGIKSPPVLKRAFERVNHPSPGTSRDAFVSLHNSAS